MLSFGSILAGKRVLRTLLTLILVASLGACGGGGGGGGPAPNSAPVANAGPAQSVIVGAVVTLNGGSSSDANNDTLSYVWTLASRPAGSSAVVSGASTVSPTFTADRPGSYVVSLVVNDGQVNSTTAAVTVTVTAPNIAPVANAGPAQAVIAGAVVTLNGSGSSDANGDTLTYAWTLTSRPTGSSAVLSGASTTGPTFTADRSGSYVVSLVVSDGQANSTAAAITVTATNIAPVAIAGPAQSVIAGAIVTLNGSGSADSNGDALTYVWALTSRPSGSSAALSGASTAAPTFTADRAGTYVVSLVVNDGQVNSTAAAITVTATAPNIAPVANAGSDRTAAAGAPVQLNGTASSDANGDALTYFWALVRPGGSTAVLTGATTATPTFTPDIVGVYAVGLVVNDGQASSVADAAVITVTSPTVGPFSVSGTVFATNVSTVDSDTNDPNQLGRAGNNTFGTAQISGNPGLVVGYVNQPSTGPAGPNFAGGDVSDIYVADMSAGQVVELNFGDAVNADLDIYVYDSLGTLAGSSIGTARSECVLVRRSGVFFIQVFAFRNASTYELSWGAPRPTSTCPNVTPATAGATSFVPGEVVAKTGTSGADTARARSMSLLQGAGMVVKAQASADSPFLMQLPASIAQRAQSLRTLRIGDRARALSASRAPEPVHAAPADASEATRLAFDTVIATKLLRNSGQFAYAELNLVVEQAQVAYGTWPPNDTALARQPHLELIKLPQAFAALNSITPRPSYTPIVAVVDTGIVADHPDIQRMLVSGYDFVSNPVNGGDGNGIDADPNDASPAGAGGVFHGTHVAGTVAAETFNGVGVVGVAPMARIMPVRVLGVSGSGTSYDIAQGILYAAGLVNDSGTVPGRRADVINLSLRSPGSCSALFANAVARARAQGSIVVAAAGNDNGAAVGQPANCPGAIAVSAIAYDGAIATYSNIGPEVAVTAPGGDPSRSSPAGRDEIWSLSATFVTNAAGATSRQPNYRGLQGTSMAAPHVAGVLAMMRAVNPSLSPATIDGLLASGAMTDEVGAAGRDNLFGYGRINALKAVLATGATPAVLPTLQVSPTLLDFGSTLTQLTVTVTQVNGSADTPAQYRSNALNQQAVLVLVPSGGNPVNGPFTYIVDIDRNLLSPSETVIQVVLTSQQGRTYTFDVELSPRPVLAPAQRGVGPLYVVAIDADNPIVSTIASTTAQSATPTYSYTMTGVNVPRVVIAAGTDLDNDGFICGSAEPCGAFATLGSPNVLQMNGNKTGVTFSLSSGSTNAASSTTGRVVRLGYPRPR